MLRTGDLIVGKYRVERVLGAGGMGQVFVATQEPLARKVAVKVLKAQSPESKGRFLREMQVLARLSHPNVVTVFDSGRAQDGSLYLAMELIDGPTLRDELVARGRMSTAAALDVASQILRGLSAAHAQKIAHLDLKPENIVLQTATGGARVVKILDFGIARILEGEAARAGLTEEDTAIGTVGYMSPEQLRGVRDDVRSDLYAVGCLLFELLAGKAPFHGRTNAELAAFHLTSTPPRIADVEPSADVPPGMEELVRALLAKDPAARPQSADAALEALSRITSSTTAATEGVTRMAAGARARWPRAAAGTAAAAGVALVVVGAIAGPRIASLWNAGPPRIAVLDIKTEPENKDLEAALIEELALALGGDPSLHVVSPFLLEQAQKRAPHNVEAWAKELDLDLGVRGVVTASGAKVALQLKVLEPPSFRESSAGRFEAASTDALIAELPANRAMLRKGVSGASNSESQAESSLAGRSAANAGPASELGARMQRQGGAPVEADQSASGRLGESAKEKVAESVANKVASSVESTVLSTDEGMVDNTVDKKGEKKAAGDGAAALAKTNEAKDVATGADAGGRPTEPGGADAGLLLATADAPLPTSPLLPASAAPAAQAASPPPSLVSQRVALIGARRAFAQGRLADVRQILAGAGDVPGAAVWRALVDVAEGSTPTPIDLTAQRGRELALARAVNALDLDAARTLASAQPDDPIAAWLCATIEKRKGAHQAAAQSEQRARALAEALPPVR